MSERLEQIDAYLDGELQGEQATELCQWINADPCNARQVALRAMLHQDIRSILHRNRVQAVHNPRQLLQELLQQEEKAQATLVKIATPPNRFAPRLQQLGTFIIQPYAISAIAAMVILCVSLFLIFGGDRDTPVNDAPIADTQSPSVSPADPTKTVATITATHNAQWADSAEGALAPGSDLRSGQRLTLTQGFAEITTNRGAIAILQAPATIELTDSDNALRLHSGKLVGICETPSSKGFLVRTPHMDITDLGTRFGVDATDRQATHVCVFEGEVQVTRSGDLSGVQTPKRLAAGQAVIGSDTVLADVILDTKPFVEALNLAIGTDDLRPRVEGTPVLWQGMTRDDMTTHRHESDLLQVYLERQGVVLKSDVAVDTLPGESWPGAHGFGKATVPAGSAVDVYLLHFDTPGAAMNQEKTIRCVIHFDRPILGLIGAQSTLRLTDQAIGHPGTAYSDEPPTSRAVATGGGVGMDAPPFTDTAVLSADGRTLTLEMTVTGGTDQARVLVQSRSSQP